MLQPVRVVFKSRLINTFSLTKKFSGCCEVDNKRKRDLVSKSHRMSSFSKPQLGKVWHLPFLAQIQMDRQRPIPTYAQTGRWPFPAVAETQDRDFFILITLLGLSDFPHVWRGCECLCKCAVFRFHRSLHSANISLKPGKGESHLPPLGTTSGHHHLPHPIKLFKKSP